MSVINNMLKDLESRKEKANVSSLDQNKLKLSNHDFGEKKKNKALIVISLLLVIMAGYFYSQIDDWEDYKEDLIEQMNAFFYSEDDDFDDDFVIDDEDEAEIVYNKVLKKVVAPKVIRVKPEVIIEPKVVEQATVQMNSKPVKAIPVVVANPTPSIKDKPKPVEATKTIKNIRYFSDDFSARIVIDSEKSLADSIERIYDGNLVTFTFKAHGYVKSSIQNNFSDKIISDFKINQDINRIKISYKTNKKGTSKYHELKPSIRQYYRFVIQIRVKGKTNLNKASKPSVSYKQGSTTKVNVINKHLLKSNRLYKESERYFLSRDYNRAKNKLIELIAFDKKHIKGNVLLAKLYIKLGYKIDAKKVLKNAYIATNKNTEIAFIYAQILTEERKYQTALQIISTVKTKPNNIPYLSLKAALFQQTNRHAEAVANYLNLLEINNNVGKWWLGLAISLEAEQKLRQAKDAYIQSLDQPDMTSSLIKFANSKIERL